MCALEADGARLSRLSIIDEHGKKYIRMANLSVIGSKRVNGVAKIHSDLVTSRLFPEFAELYPNKFTNVTNGITPRRWMAHANPALSRFITDALGSSEWIGDLDRLRDLEKLVDDSDALAALRGVKAARKGAAAQYLSDQYGFALDTSSCVSVQIKRIHEYKRQLLFLFHVIHRYLRIKDGEELPPRTFLLSGKAAPGYRRAKQIIELAHAIAGVVNNDPDSASSVFIFCPNYSVSVAGCSPGADVK